MKSYQTRPATRGHVFPLTVLTLMLLCATTLQAQIRARGPNTPPPPPLGMSDRDRNLLEREAQLTMIERERKRAIRSDPQLAFTQIREDFKRIQVINQEVLRGISSGNGLNYKFISDATAEIKKRAARLKDNLIFPEIEEGEERRKSKDPDGVGLKPSLMALDSLIYSFVTNPVFKDAGVVDAKLGGRARRDLESIIELSDKVRKSAERLRKNDGN